MQLIQSSDYKAGKTHVFIGDGELDFPGFFHEIDKASLNALTLECSLYSNNSPQEASFEVLVARMKEARTRLLDYVV